MINKLNTIIFSILLVWCSIGNCAEITPENIIGNFYIADLNGARLSTETYNKVRSLIEWDKEPGWDTLFIIKNVRIEEFKNSKNNEKLVKVIYQNIGLLNGEKIITVAFTEEIKIVLYKKNSKWLIKGPIFPPHVYPSALIKHYENLLKLEQNEERIQILTLLLDKLKNLE